MTPINTSASGLVNGPFDSSVDSVADSVIDVSTDIPDNTSTDNSLDATVPSTVIHLVPNTALVSPDQPSFVKFSRFPPEIRDMIWKFSIPRGLSIFPQCPQIYPRKRPKESEDSGSEVSDPEDSDSEDSDSEDYLRCRNHKYFDIHRLRLYFPLPRVAEANREARKVVLTWAAKQGTRPISGPDHEPLNIFFRKFDLVHDIFYIQPKSLWLRDYDSPSFGRRWLRRWMDAMGVANTVAIHKETLSCVWIIGWLAAQFPSVYVVCNARPTQFGCGQIGNSSGEVWIWAAQEGKFNLIADDTGRTEGQGGQLSSCYEGIDTLIEGLIQTLVDYRIDVFHIRPVTVSAR